MNVLTFFSDLGNPEPRQLLELWEPNWRAHGWTPNILDPRFIYLHPDAGSLFQATASLPTTTHWAFEVTCWQRWPAFAAYMLLYRIPAALCADYDMVNLGFNPDHARALAKDGPALHLGGGLMLLDRDAAWRLPSVLARHVNNNPSHSHNSDWRSLRMLAESGDFIAYHPALGPQGPQEPLTPTPDWKPTRTLVHLAHGATQYDRVAAFQSLTARFPNGIVGT